MATETIYLSGELSWVKAKADKLDTKFRPNWSTNLDLDQASMNVFKEKKVGVKLRENDAGALTMAQFRRYADNDFKDSDKRSAKLPPRVLVLAKDGNIKTTLGMAKLYDGLIGNGSKGQVKLDIFDTKYPTKGHRLVSILVTDLVQYQGDDASGVDETEAPLDDEIPF